MKRIFNLFRILRLKIVFVILILSITDIIKIHYF